jgi:putative zinc finger protein
MRERESREQRIHGRVWELLPWYVNDTLSERERERVEAHLAECPRCQEEESICRRTAEAVRNAGEVAPSPHPVQFQRMLARIEANEENAREERDRRGWERLGAFVATPGRLRMALVAQAAVILLLIGALVWQPQGYRTESEPVLVPVPSLHVLFTPQASAEEICELLHKVQGKITDGPSPMGVYTVVVPAGQEPLKIALARLRSERKVVAFAGPVAGSGYR